MPYSLYVGHLPTDVTKEDLINLFSECGEVKQVYVGYPEPHMAYTYAFVQFSEAKCVLRATQEMGHWTFQGRTLRVEISHATKEVLRMTTPPRYPHWRTVTRDNSDRSRVKEACFFVNKELDLVHGDEQLDIVTLLAGLEAERARFAPQVRGNICAGVCATKESLLDSIVAFGDEEPSVMEQRKEELRSKMAILQSDLESHHSDIVAGKKAKKDPTSVRQKEGDLQELRGSQKHLIHSNKTVEMNMEHTDWKADGLNPVSDSEREKSNTAVMPGGENLSEERIQKPDGHSPASENPHVTDDPDCIGSWCPGQNYRTLNAGEDSGSFLSRVQSFDQVDPSTQLQERKNAGMPFDLSTLSSDPQNMMETFKNALFLGALGILQDSGGLNKFPESNTCNGPGKIIGSQTHGLSGKDSGGSCHAVGPVTPWQLAHEFASKMCVGLNTVQPGNEQPGFRLQDCNSSKETEMENCQVKHGGPYQQGPFPRGPDHTPCLSHTAVHKPSDSPDRNYCICSGGKSLPQNSPVPVANYTDVFSPKDGLLPCCGADACKLRVMKACLCTNSAHSFPHNIPATAQLSADTPAPYCTSACPRSVGPFHYNHGHQMSSALAYCDRSGATSSDLHPGGRALGRYNGPAGLADAGRPGHPNNQLLHAACSTSPFGRYVHNSPPLLNSFDLDFPPACTSTCSHTHNTCKSFYYDRGVGLNLLNSSAASERPLRRPFFSRPDKDMEEKSTDRNVPDTSTPNSSSSSGLEEEILFGKGDLSVQSGSDDDDQGLQSDDEKRKPGQAILQRKLAQFGDEIDGHTENDSHTWYSCGDTCSKLQASSSLDEKSFDSGISKDVLAEKMNASASENQFQDAASQSSNPEPVRKVISQALKDPLRHQCETFKDPVGKTSPCSSLSDVQGKMLQAGRGRGSILSLLAASQLCQISQQVPANGRDTTTASAGGGRGRAVLRVLKNL